MFDTAKPFFPEEEIDLILGEIRLILENKEMLTMGSHVKQFEEKFSSYNNTKYGIATNSCTTALETVLRCIDVKEKEVIVPTQTFIATGSSVYNAGGKPIFADINDDYNISLDSIKNKISSKTKAVTVVHFGGLIGQEIFEIKEFCRKKGLYLIEDCAHAHGASINGIKSGSIGDFGCFSFYATKVMTAGEGGMILTNNEEFYDKLASYRNRGIDIHSEVELFINPGSNFRMAEVNAILGLSQFKRLEEFLKHRREIARIYDQNLQNLHDEGSIEIIKRKNTLHSYWRYVIRINEKFNREKLFELLLNEDIKICWPYDPPLHLQPVFKKIYNTREGMLQISEELMKKHVCLPMHLEISSENAEYIVSKFKEKLIEVI